MFVLRYLSTNGTVTSAVNGLRNGTRTVRRRIAMEEISASRLDGEFKDRVAARLGGASVKACFACGACTGGCPVSEVDPEFDPRKLIRMVVLGLKEQLLTSPLIWYCQLCNTCSFVCPQDVRFSEAMSVLRQMAVEEGYVSPELGQRMWQAEMFSRRLRSGLLRAAAAQAKAGQALDLGKALEAGLKVVQGS
jgi:heterodisulfide reductase subunit C